MRSGGSKTLLRKPKLGTSLCRSYWVRCITPAMVSLRILERSLLSPFNLIIQVLSLLYLLGFYCLIRNRFEHSSSKASLFSSSCLTQGRVWITKAARIRSSVWKVKDKRPGLCSVLIHKFKQMVLLLLFFRY